MTRTRTVVVLVILLSACATMVTDILKFGSIGVETITRSGVPVSGSEITLYNDVQIMGVGFTDTDGKYLFEFVPPQFYGVHNEPPEGYMRPEDMIGGSSTAFTHQIVIEEGDDKDVSFTFIKIGPGRIDVSVKDPEGNPVEETKVFLYGPFGDLAEKVVDSSGFVSFDPVSFGNKGIRIVPPQVYLETDGGFFYKDALLIDEGWVEEVSFIVDKCLGTLRAGLNDFSGAPVPDYPVRLYSATETVEIKQTETDGIAVFDSISCGNRGLALVEKSGWIFEKGRDLSFHDGIYVKRGTDQTFSFNVQPCSGTLRASVNDVSGAPVPDYPVRLYSATETVEIKQTETDGIAVFDSINCGERALSLVKRPGWIFEEGRDLSFYDVISVTLQSDQAFSFGGTICSGEISVQVEDQSGNHVSGALLELYAENQTWDEDVTGATGSVTFSNACGMDIGVKVTPPSGFTVVQGRGLSFFDGLRPDLNGPAELVFRLQASQD